MSVGYVRNMRPCYNVHMQSGSERGVGYAFWRRVKAEQAARGWTDAELSDRAGGLAWSTIDRLKKGKRPPLARVVNALADALEIDRAEAYRLAGRPPYDPTEDEPEPPADPGRSERAREAIRNDPLYDEWQRGVLLEIFDVIERAVLERDQGDDQRRATG